MSTMLIVDDEQIILKYLQKQLSSSDCNVLTATYGEEAISIYEKKSLDLMLLDIKLPDMNGMDILKYIREKDNSLPIILMTAYSGIQGAVEAIKLGASDYIAKPFDIEELKYVIARCLETQKAVIEVNHIRSSKKAKYSYDNIITNNPETLRLIDLSKRIANKTQSTILILGESGTGKELFANAIHYNDIGPRSKGSFIAVNCTTLSEGVLESELFGHEKGSFTGAVGSKKGLFEIADKGTIFLDEIGEIDFKTQVKLLRFLEERSFQRVGGIKDIEVDVRIIAATNKDLLKSVHDGKFREDLYYRLNVMSIEIPPLRHRKEDIPLLVDHFISMFRKTLNKDIRSCSDEALNIMANYEWPGNIRELRNIIERAMLLSDSKIINISDLPIEITRHVGVAENRKINLLDQMDLNKMIKLYVEKVFIDNNKNMTRAANALNITRQRLKRILAGS